MIVIKNNKNNKNNTIDNNNNMFYRIKSQIIMKYQHKWKNNIEEIKKNIKEELIKKEEQKVEENNREVKYDNIIFYMFYYNTNYLYKLKKYKQEQEKKDIVKQYLYSDIILHPYNNIYTFENQNNNMISMIEIKPEIKNMIKYLINDEVQLKYNKKKQDNIILYNISNNDFL